MKQKKFCKICGALYYAKGLCMKCYHHQYYKKLYESYPGLRKKQLGNLHACMLCNTLQQHHDNLKDDPEHLSTEFILKTIKNVKKSAQVRK